MSLRAALADLYAELRRVAVAGIVPEDVFRARTESLGLSDVERARLGGALARMGLLIGNRKAHTATDTSPTKMVARSRTEAAGELLGRYTDDEGYVTEGNLDGVARLAGLSERETRLLRESALVRPEAAGVGGERRMEKPLPPPQVGPTAVPGSGEFADAVRAAKAVLKEDRLRLRPEGRLLSALDEVGLAVLVRGGTHAIATEPTDADLAALPPMDDRVRARDCLVLHNQRLVHSLVRRYLEQGLEYEDLFQHGVLGLMRAARKFDPTMGNKFSTYATWWIRQSMTRAIADEGAVIRIPVHMHEVMRKVALAERALQAQGRPSRAIDVAVACDMTVQKVEEVRRLSRRTDSLDRVVGDGVHLGDLVALARPLPSVESLVLEVLRHRELLAMLDVFPERKAQIVLRRTGLDGGKPSTLEELGKEFGVTRERIRQLEVQAFGEMRRMLVEAGADTERGRTPRRGLGKPGKAVGPRETPVAVSRAGPSAAHGEARTTAPSSVPETLPAPHEEHAPEAVTEPITGSATGAAAAGRAVPDAEPEILAPEAIQYTADWAQALPPLAPFAGDVARLAEYALLALGYLQLTILLGQPAADSVIRAAKDRGTLDRPEVMALTVLERVFSALKDTGLKPEDFFERPSAAMAGVTPRMYLAKKPLVRSESRLAVRDALREFTSVVCHVPSPASAPPPTAGEAERPRMEEPAPSEQPQNTPPVDGFEKQGPGAAATETESLPDTEAFTPTGTGRPSHQVQGGRGVSESRLREEHHQPLAEQPQEFAIQPRAAHEDTEHQLDALEEALLRRVDISLRRQEQNLRRQADDRVERLEAQHREAQQAMWCRAIEAEQAATAAAEQSLQAHQRANDADHLLRRQQHETEARTADLRTRLRQKEAELARRNQDLHELAQRSAAQIDAAERHAALRIAQAEQDAWARITELEKQVADLTVSGDNSTTLRSRWHRA
ncbi:sigma-70 family RNA polymerase sigma factor [Streptomyces sp. NPDC002402]